MKTKFIIENPIQYDKGVSGYFVRFGQNRVAVWSQQKDLAKRFESEDSAQTFITGEFPVQAPLKVATVDAIDCVKI